MPLFDWSFKILVIEISEIEEDWETNALFDTFFYTRPVQPPDDIWVALERIELRTSTSVEAKFRARLDALEAQSRLTTVQRRVLSLVKFVGSDGRVRDFVVA